MTQSEVRGWIRYACDSCGVPELAERIKLVWSRRLTRSKGIASRDKGVYTIKLSPELFRRDNEQGNIDTVVHEACHIIEYYKHGTGGHGARWERYMRRCGLKPVRCHNVDNTGLVRRYLYECPNGCYPEFKLSTRMHNQVRRGQYRLCNRCKSRISWSGRVEG
jgi:predicted SprT family Zn-dependent metalloprotease